MSRFDRKLPQGSHSVLATLLYVMSKSSLHHDKFCYLDLSVIVFKIVLPYSCFHTVVSLLFTYLGPFMFPSVEFTALQSDVFCDFPDMPLSRCCCTFFISVESAQILPFSPGTVLYKT